MMTHIILAQITLIVSVLQLSLAQQCPDGAVKHRRNCYQIFNSSVVVYEEAERVCHGLGGELLSDHMSEDEKQLILSNLPASTAWVERPQNLKFSDSSTSQDECKAFYPMDEDNYLWDVPCRLLLGFVCKLQREGPTRSPITSSPASNERKCVNVNPGSIEEEVLNLHNEFRSRHQDTGSLCWDPIMQKEATVWARNLGNNGGLDHSFDTKHGENIYSSLVSKSDSKNIRKYYKHAVEMWYNEIRFYNWHDPHFHTIYGHFTQLVWVATRHLGCGYAFGLNTKGRKRIVIVCRYSPRGSIFGPYERMIYADNVKPLSDAENDE